ncbi:MAG: hypothetical protein WC880_01790 [Candidatus Paceibacterota bacterium]
MSRRQMLQWFIICALIAVPVLIYFAPTFVALLYNILAFLAPVWLPVALFAIFWPLWLNVIRSRFVDSIPYVTLELKPGDETPPTAKAMELVFYSLYHRTNISRVDAYLRGKVRSSWSFEVYAHNGRVRFFAHVPESYRVLLEGRIQAEYRDIDIQEVRDYSRELHFDPFHMRLTAREYTLSKPDPYPLKTYVAYEDAREKRDVFGDIVEGLARTNVHEHVFVSIVMRPHQRERFNIFENPRDTLHEAAHIEIKKLVGSSGEMNKLAPTTKTIVSAIESALNKPSFDCGIRSLYIADREHFDESYEDTLTHLLDPLNDNDLNGFVAYDPNHRPGFVLSEVFGAVPILASSHLLNLYRRRAFFAPPYYGKAFVLNTEELATLFHLPHASRGSALARMRGLTLEPPENLPV